MERASRISRAQAIAIPTAAPSSRAEIWVVAVTLILLAIALVVP